MLDGWLLLLLLLVSLILLILPPPSLHLRLAIASLYAPLCKLSVFLPGAALGYCTVWPSTSFSHGFCLIPCLPCPALPCLLALLPPSLPPPFPATSLLTTPSFLPPRADSL